MCTVLYWKTSTSLPLSCVMRQICYVYFHLHFNSLNIFFNNYIVKILSILRNQRLVVSSVCVPLLKEAARSP